MTDMEILRQMIKPTVQINVAQSYGKIMVELTEPQQPGSSVKLFGLPENVMIIKADAFKSPDSVFTGSKGECKRADFIVIAERKEKMVIIYIEMKKTKKQENEIVQQLHGAKCFVSYCQEIGWAFFHEPAFLKTGTDAESRLRPSHLEFNHLAGVNR